MSKQSITLQQARKKAEHYCAYQERSQHEVRTKLYEWGLPAAHVEELISDLISENFLNEERFAIAFALGKFRIKNWGKIKIRHELISKRIPEKLINKALKTIDNTDYFTKIETLIARRKSLEPDQRPYHRNIAISRYLAGKGYEPELIGEILGDYNSHDDEQ